MTAPIVEVNSPSLGGWTTTENGIDVLPGELVSVRLVDPAGARIWRLSVFDTDELVVAPVITQAASVSAVATFVAPSEPVGGWTVLFQTTVGFLEFGRDRFGVAQPSYTTTFGVFRRSPNGWRCVAVNERFESNAEHGWASTLNPLLRSSLATGTGVTTDRTFYTTSPLRIDGGASGNLSANRTLSLVPGTIEGQLMGWDGGAWLARSVAVLTGLTLSAFSTGVLHSTLGVVSSSLIVDADIDELADIAVAKLAPGADGEAIVTAGGLSQWGIPATATGLTPGPVGQFYVTAAGPLGAWAAPTGDWDGPYTATVVRALTGTANVVAMHSTTILWDTTVTGILKGADVTANSATAPSFTVQAANATGTLSTGGALTLTAGAGTSTPGALTLKRGTNTVFSATSGYLDSSYQTSIFAGPLNGMQLFTDRLYFGNSAGAAYRGLWNATGLRIGDSTQATEKLEVVGNIKIDTTVATPKLFQADVTTNGATGAALTVQAQNATGTTSTGGSLTAQTGSGTTQPGAFTVKRGTSTVIACSGAYIAGTDQVVITAGILNGIYLDADFTQFRTSLGVAKGLWNLTGLRVGDGAAATEKLEVVGNIKIDTTALAPKFFQADNTTNGATAAVLTVQAQNATGTTSLGGDLTLTSGTGTTPGALKLQRGGVTIGTVSAIGLTVASTTSATGRAVIGSLIGSEASFGAVWLGNITPSSSNYTLYSGNSVTALSAGVETQLVIGGATIGLFRSAGLALGLASGNNPAEKLHVLGSICIDTATVTPKFYQRDNVTNAATATSLTVQAANATGTTSTGGDLNLTSGTGTTAAGVVNIKSGGSTKITVNAAGATITGTLSATDLSVTGSLTANSGGGKAILTGLVGNLATHGALYLGNITPSAANYILYSDGTNAVIQAPTGSFYFMRSNSAIGYWTSTGFRVGDGNTPTEKLDVAGDARFVTSNTGVNLSLANASLIVENTDGANGCSHIVFSFAGTPQCGFRGGFNAGLYYYAGGAQGHQFVGALDASVVDASISSAGILIGGTLGATSSAKLDVIGNAKIGVGAGKVYLDSLTSAPTTYGGIWLGAITPSATNTTLYSNGSTVTQLQVVGAGNLYVLVNQTGRMNLTATGLRLGADVTNPTERLEVLGNIKIDTATTTPKFYQADVTTVSATGATLTIQAQNATGTTSTGGQLVLQSGDGTTGPGGFYIKRGSNNVLETGGNYLDSGYYTVLTGGPVNGLQLKSDAFYFYTNAGVAKGRWNNTGLRVGDGTTPTERFEVLGNIKIDTATVTPKIYQADVTTNGVNGTTLTVRAQNATGTTAIGGYLDLQSGSGTTTNGYVRISVGPSLQSYATGGIGTGHFSQFWAGTTGGFYFDADIFRLRSSAGVEHANWRPAGLRIGDGTAATEKLVVAGNAIVLGYVSSTKVNNTFPITTIADSHMVLDNTGAQTQLSFAFSAAVVAGIRTDNVGNISLHTGASGYLQFYKGLSSGTSIGNFSSSGLAVGYAGGTVATAMLDIAGRAKFGVGAGKIVIDSDISFPASDACIWFGPITPSTTNSSLRGDGTTYTIVNGPSTIRFRIANTGRVFLDATGMKIGAESAASEMLHVVGNVCIDAATTTPKIYQRDNTTNSATAATLTLQAANATGTTAIGGTLDLRSGTGTTRHGDITFSFGTGLMGGFSSRVLALTLHVGAPTTSNWVFTSGGAGSIYNAVTTGHEFRIAGAAIMNLGPNGLKIDTTQTYPTERLEVVGSAKVTVGLKIGTGVVTVTEGTAVPSAAEVDGSVYLRSGSPNGSAYVRTNGAWALLGGGGFQTLTVTTTPVTISNGADYIVFVDTTAARSITLPTPASARTVVLIDISGLCGTNNITLVRAGAEQIMGIAASYVFATDWGAWTVRSNGTNWFIQ